jgi:aminoglycoside/choline kinase family phosphotransferase
MNKNKKELLINLFEKWAGEAVVEFIQLPLSGSYREYYRIKSITKKALAVYNADRKENIAFLEFSRHFASLDLNVPTVFSEDIDNNIYLIEDLGDKTLFSLLIELRSKEGSHKELIQTYRKVIDNLPLFQVKAGKELNYKLCYPRAKFDKQSMMWDLNYFKYYFLKLGKIPFDEQELETDFNKFTDYLLGTDCSYFLYRDFQSRNIMIKDGEPYFIDYQGGRKGALQYDLASLLFDAKAELFPEVRTELLQHYISVIKKYVHIDETDFIQMFYGYVLIRILQAMGAYGFRGFYERKEHFLKSIPPAIENLSWLLSNVSLPIEIPHLIKSLEKIAASQELKQFKDSTQPYKQLEVSVFSFSYMKSIPQDYSGNGGGFVFDCRAIHNPGRYKEYKHLTGKDEKVKKFLQERTDAEEFLSNVFALVKKSVDKYKERNFRHLMVSFGCTGGQHRSVYCAEQLSEFLNTIPGINVNLRHIELEKKESENPGTEI